MYATSALIPRSGFAGAVTGTPLACNRVITPFQLDASANAPCTSTTVGFVADTGLGLLSSSGEEVDEQLVDAISLVVVHPVRRVGKSLDPVEVGHVVGVRLGEIGAEVGIALPPDDQRRRRKRANLCRGFLLRLPDRRAVVVDHPGGCPWLRPRF